MKLYRGGRDNLVLGDRVTPPLEGTRQVSFDYGETWVDGIATGDDWSWTVAGPDFDAVAEGLDPNDASVTVIEDTTQVWWRIKDNPILAAKEATRIDLWG